MNLLKNKMGMRVLTLTLCAALGGSVLAVKAESVYDGITLLCLVNGMIIAFLHLSGTCLHYDGFDRRKFAISEGLFVLFKQG